VKRRRTQTAQRFELGVLRFAQNSGGLPKHGVLRSGQNFLARTENFFARTENFL
jgi:hypothetical protein